MQNKVERYQVAIFSKKLKDEFKAFANRQGFKPDHVIRCLMFYFLCNNNRVVDFIRSEDFNSKLYNAYPELLEQPKIARYLAPDPLEK